jgi:hypothetical protein
VPAPPWQTEGEGLASIDTGALGQPISPGGYADSELGLGWEAWKGRVPVRPFVYRLEFGAHACARSGCRGAYSTLAPQLSGCPQTDSASEATEKADICLSGCLQTDAYPETGEAEPPGQPSLSPDKQRPPKG